MTPWEAKEHRKGVIETALLRAHVRKLLEMPLDVVPDWLVGWREEGIRLFNRMHWWDLELRNAGTKGAHPLNNPLNQQALELPPQDSVSTNSTTSAVEEKQDVI